MAQVKITHFYFKF